MAFGCSLSLTDTACRTENPTQQSAFSVFFPSRMETDNHVFSLLEEHVVSQGKGRCVVRCYLKDSSWELILAVVDTERSSRHMLYVVSVAHAICCLKASSVTTYFKYMANSERRSQTVHTLPQQYKMAHAFKSNTKGKLPTKEEIKSHQSKWMLSMRMDTDSHVFSSWEEHIVSWEKGRRVVHFFLKDTSGELILAVVGTEKSSGKMLYVVSEDYLDLFGHTSTINSDTKWRAKKHVVEWLTFLISKHLGSPPISNTPRGEKRSASMAGHRSNEVSQNITEEGSSAQGPRWSRSVSESGHSGSRKSISSNRVAQGKPPTYPKLKIKFPDMGQVGIQLAEPQHKPSFEVGDNLEVLCHDSGMKGCWFRCKVLQVAQKRLKVQYDDILDCDGLEKLEEWIPSNKVAGSDKLGVRCTGRLTVRPWPLEDSSHHSFEVGAAVDAWWSDGWWEGVVAGFDVCGRDHLQVYFPGENILLEIHRKNVRTSRDWVDDKWVEVEGKKDIKSFISSAEKQDTHVLVAPEDNKMASTSKPSAEKQDTCVLKLKKRWCIDFLAGNKN